MPFSSEKGGKRKREEKPRRRKGRGGECDHTFQPDPNVAC